MPKKAQSVPRAFTLKKVQSSAPEARDEGPRLIPLDSKKPSLEDYSRRYLELADVALDEGRKPTPARIPKRPR
jgi:hypothetical protein